LILEKGCNTLANVRIRGKIRREEWPKIAERFRKGETLTEIARSYQCTAPAIRYIIARASSRPAKGKALALGTPNRPPPGDRGRSLGNVRALEVAPSAKEIWSRINNDIATFLAAMDALSLNESDGAYEALLMATDRLLWASARTRLEVEQILKRRKEGLPARRALA
jgi:uncharacterized protein (DUF433 family)